MKISLAVALLLGYTNALRAAPDVFGPNGENYANDSPSQDLARIGIDIKQAGSGDRCKAGDWATVHWSAFLTDNRMVSDSKSEGQGLPKTFSVGNSEVFKCWDLAVPQLTKGTKARVSCPAHYAWGDAYTQSPLGGEPIPLGSDVYFDLEVVDCNRTPDDHPMWTDRGTQPKFSTLQPLNCFYLHNQESEHESTPLVLNCDDSGACGLEEFVWDDKDQMFWYDLREDKEWGRIAVFNKEWQLEKAKWLTVDEKNNLKSTSDISKAYKFFWQMRDNTLQVKKENGVTYEVTTPQVRKWANVNVNPVRDQVDRSDKNAKWSIEYCSLENKPNPEAANEQIPQALKQKSFPDDWHKTGGHDYPLECNGAGVAMKPYQTHEPKWVMFEYCRSIDTKFSRVQDATSNDVIQYGRRPYCWNMMGWKYERKTTVDTDLDSFEMKLRIKVEGEKMVRGGIILKGAYKYSIIQDKCKLNEWCELDTMEASIDPRRLRWWHSRIYFATWYVPDGTTVKVDIGGYKVCGYNSKTFDIAQLK